MTFFELQVVSRYPTIECREFLEESPGVAAIEGTQTTFSPGNRSMMRSDSTMASETEVLLIPPGPIMQMREVSPRRSNCAIPSTKPSRPWKISGFMGISWRESRPVPRSLEVNRYVEYPPPCGACHISCVGGMEITIADEGRVTEVIESWRNGNLFF